MTIVRAAFRALMPIALLVAVLGVPVHAQAAVTYVVNSTADTTDGTCSGPGNAVSTGDCTLREAILNANGNAGTDSISFGLLGTAPFTISPTTQLPDISQQVNIDGTTQSQYSNAPVVGLSGSAHSIADGLVLATGSGGSTIRGLQVGGFSEAGIKATSPGNTIAASYIGVGFNGVTAQHNGTGVSIVNINNLVGGSTAADRNLISGNTLGVDILVGSSTVRGNYIGTDPAGTSAVPNSFGIQLNASDNDIIGGTSPSDGNLISGNTGVGVFVGGNNSNPANGNVIENNLIGTDKDGTGALGNGSHGVELGNYATNNTVGEANLSGGGFASVSGSGPHGNVIDFNSGDGVSVVGPGTSGNTISQNSIDGNGGLGVDLNNDGVTQNDDDIGGDPQTPDTDTGSNNLQNWPELSTVQVDDSEGIQTITSGDLYSTPNTDFTIDYYSSTQCDPSGNGEGRFFENSTTVTTDAAGHADVGTSFGQTSGSVLTATATDQSTGDTSEFSNCVHVPQEIDADLAVTKSDAAPNGPDPVPAGNDVGYQVDVTNQGPDDSTGVAVTDDIPPQATFISATGNGWSCDYDSGSQTVFCQRDGLHVDQTASIIVVVKSPATPPADCPADSQLSSCITDSATADFTGPDNQFDPNTGNNTATESTEVQPKPANPDDSTGFVPPDGGTVTTGNNPNSTDTTDASVQLPPGPGGVVDIHEETPPPDLCVNGCTGQAVQIDIPDGYSDSSQPPRVVLKYDVTVVRPKGGAKIYIKKGNNPPQLVPPCTTHGVADPHPCVGARQRLPNGDLRVTVLLLSGDPLCGKH